MSAKTIVILGGSYAAVETAHRLLKQSSKLPEFKIILVAPNTHLYWNLAVPRAIVPGGFFDEKIFQPIAPGFAQYGPKKVEFILGSAEGVDPASNTVKVSTATGEKLVKYDELILATGTHSTGDTPFKGRGSTEATRDALHEFQNKVDKAKTIIIAGAGATGVELAGELGYEYGSKKKITLITSAPTVLPGVPASTQNAATSQLKALHVAITASTTVTSSSPLPNGQTELTLSDSSKITTDLYLPAIGLSPNSSYLPKKFLNETGFVVVDEFLRVKGEENIWAVGDISSVQRPQYMNIQKQSPVLAKNLGLVLTKGRPVAFDPSGKDMLAVPIGKKSGTGHMGNWKLPGFMINFVKGKTYFTQNLPGVVDGSLVK